MSIIDINPIPFVSVPKLEDTINQTPVLSQTISPTTYIR